MIEIVVPGTWGAVPAGVEREIRLTAELSARSDDLGQAFRRVGGGWLDDNDLRTIDGHTSVLRLTSRECSMEAAEAILEGGALLVADGGAGVLVESSGIAHSASQWLNLAALNRKGQLEGIYYAFVGIDVSESEQRSRGMQSVGLPDAAVVGGLGSVHDSEVLQSFLLYLLAARPRLGPRATFSADQHGRVHVVRADGDTPIELQLAGPLPVVGLRAVSSVVAGGGRNLALTTEGEVLTWGQQEPYPWTKEPVPILVAGLEQRAIQIAAGFSHCLAILDDGSIAAWGTNTRGQIGDGSTDNRVGPVVPVKVAGRAKVVNAGMQHSLVLMDDGSLMAWGGNSFGQLGDGSTDDRHAPVRVDGLSERVATIAAGLTHNLALLESGSVVAWGDNRRGALGSATDEPMSAVPLVVPGITDAVAIAAGSCSLALLADGTVVAWGANSHGQLGDGTQRDRAAPAPVPGVVGASAIAAGSHHGLALVDGSVLSWGERSLSPTAVPGLLDAVRISAGGTHNLAQTSDGTVVAWGEDNYWGQLGLADHHVGRTDWLPRPLSPRRAAELASLAAPSVRLRVRPGAAPGASRVGGQPDLAPGVEWPAHNGRRLAFVAQIDLADIASKGPVDALPERGMLSFFCDPEQGFVDDCAGRVLFCEQPSALRPMEWPADLAENDRFGSAALVAEHEMAPAPLGAHEVSRLRLTRDESAAYNQTFGEEDSRRPIHRMLGYPDPVQDDPRNDDEVLLLQVDSDDDISMIWGDLGRLYVVIAADDLGARRFDRARVVLQSH